MGGVSHGCGRGHIFFVALRARETSLHKSWVRPCLFAPEAYVRLVESARLAENSYRTTESSVMTSSRAGCESTVLRVAVVGWCG